MNNDPSSDRWQRDLLAGPEERMSAFLESLKFFRGPVPEGLRVLPRYRDGTPGIRDHDCRCEYFKPEGERTLLECWGDGHYLCRECVNFDPRDEEEGSSDGE